MSIAVIAGATGLVGRACLQALLASPEYDSVVALTRRPLGPRNAKLRELITDGKQLGELPPMPGGVVFCALGTTIRKAGSQAAFREVDYDYPLRLAQAAQAAGATRMALVSSVGANAAAPNFYLRVKGELEEELKKVGFAALHVFRPSMLMGTRQESRPGERVGIAVARALQWALVGGLSIYCPIEAELVGRAMVAAASKPLTGVQVYHFSSIRALCPAS